MKGVFIPGMKMPTGCAVCELNNDSLCVLIDGCVYDESNGITRRSCCPLQEVEIPDTETVTSLVDYYDQEEIHENCTVQVLTNSKTGETSVGWWRNEE